uniref:Uncharacterized protein n=1 Tax=Zea mays TaxID=4577 RepID=A0A804R6L3_MAIZE
MQIILELTRCRGRNSRGGLHKCAPCTAMPNNKIVAANMEEKGAGGKAAVPHDELPRFTIFLIPNRREPPLDLVELVCLHHRISLGNGVPGSSPVVELAVVLVGVAVECAVQVPTPAVESRKSNPLPAGAAPVRPYLPPFGDRRHPLAGSGNNRLHDGVAAVHDAVDRGGSQLGLILLRYHLLVALGAHVHGRRAAEEATVIDAEDGSLGGLAPSLLVLHGFLN